MGRIWALLGAVTLLGACAAPTEETGEGERSDEMAVQPPPESPEPSLPELSASQHEQEAITLLSRGEWPLAERHLERALELRPGSARAQLLLEQIRVDPTEHLGETSFQYTVQPGESLSQLAQRFLGDTLKFPILARYNDIDNPQDLRAGQVIRIPGTAPPPEAMAGGADAGGKNAEALRERAVVAESGGDLEDAYVLISEAVDLDPTSNAARTDLARIRFALIDRYSSEAYQHEENGELVEAIDVWKKVLELDPNNIAAQINLNRLETRTN